MMVALSPITLELIAKDLSSATPAKIEASLKALISLNPKNMLLAVQRANFEGVVGDLEDLLAVLEPLVPELAEVRLALMVLMLVVHGYEEGWIRGAVPLNPAEGQGTSF